MNSPFNGNLGASLGNSTSDDSSKFSSCSTSPRQYVRTNRFTIPGHGSPNSELPAEIISRLFTIRCWTFSVTSIQLPCEDDSWYVPGYGQVSIEGVSNLHCGVHGFVAFNCKHRDGSAAKLCGKSQMPSVNE